MTAILITAIAGTGASTGHLSERDVLDASIEPVRSQVLLDAPGNSRSEKCHARKGLRFYRGRYVDWRELKGGVTSRPSLGRRPRNCADARWLASVWKKRAWIERQTYEVWTATRTLRDFTFRDGNHAWHKAVREVQRVFPGTESWLLSCSAAEGGHGRWVGYSGVSYSTWLRDSDTVGGPLQFRFSTFTGMYRRATDYAVGRGFRVPRMDSTTAWRSALGQALAGGWARFTGNDNSHWSASWGNGC